MITKRLNTAWRIERPLRAFARGFVALSLFIGAAIPFMGDLPSWRLCALGVFGYPAFLSFLSVGICLLPVGLRTRVFIFMLTLQVLCVAFMLALLVLVRSSARGAIFSLLSPAIWTVGAILVALLSLAVYGWYFRVTQDTAKDP